MSPFAIPGLTIEQWNRLDVAGWDGLRIDSLPTGGGGDLVYDPAGNRLTQTNPVTGEITTFIYGKQKENKKGSGLFYLASHVVRLS